MALRFRKSMKIAPGLTLNLGKKSASVRVGGKGAGFTMGTAGSRATVGAPGSGLSYTKRIGKGSETKVEPRMTEPSGPRRLGAFGWLGILVGIGAIAWLVTALL